MRGWFTSRKSTPVNDEENEAIKLDEGNVGGGFGTLDPLPTSQDDVTTEKLKQSQAPKAINEQVDYCAAFSSDEEDEDEEEDEVMDLPGANGNQNQWSNDDQSTVAGNVPLFEESDYASVAGADDNTIASFDTRTEGQWRKNKASDFLSDFFEKTEEEDGQDQEPLSKEESTEDENPFQSKDPFAGSDPFGSNDAFGFNSKVLASSASTVSSASSSSRKSSKKKHKDKEKSKKDKKKEKNSDKSKGSKHKRTTPVLVEEEEEKEAEDEGEPTIKSTDADDSKSIEQQEALPQKESDNTAQERNGEMEGDHGNDVSGNPHDDNPNSEVVAEVPQGPIDTSNRGEADFSRSRDVVDSFVGKDGHPAGEDKDDSHSNEKGEGQEQEVACGDENVDDGSANQAMEENQNQLDIKYVEDSSPTDDQNLDEQSSNGEDEQSLDRENVDEVSAIADKTRSNQSENGSDTQTVVDDEKYEEEADDDEEEHSQFQTNEEDGSQPTPDDGCLDDDDPDSEKEEQPELRSPSSNKQVEGQQILDEMQSEGEIDDEPAFYEGDIGNDSKRDENEEEPPVDQLKTENNEDSELACDNDEDCDDGSGKGIDKEQAEAGMHVESGVNFADNVDGDEDCDKQDASSRRMFSDDGVGDESERETGSPSQLDEDNEVDVESLGDKDVGLYEDKTDAGNKNESANTFAEGWDLDSQSSSEEGEDDHFSDDKEDGSGPVLYDESSVEKASPQPVARDVVTSQSLMDKLSNGGPILPPAHQVDDGDDGGDGDGDGDSNDDPMDVGQVRYSYEPVVDTGRESSKILRHRHSVDSDISDPDESSNISIEQRTQQAAFKDEGVLSDEKPSMPTRNSSGLLSSKPVAMAGVSQRFPEDDKNEDHKDFSPPIPSRIDSADSTDWKVKRNDSINGLSQDPSLGGSIAVGNGNSTRKRERFDRKASIKAELERARAEAEALRQEVLSGREERDRMILELDEPPFSIMKTDVMYLGDVDETVFDVIDSSEVDDLDPTVERDEIEMHSSLPGFIAENATTTDKVEPPEALGGFEEGAGVVEDDEELVTKKDRDRKVCNNDDGALSSTPNAFSVKGEPHSDDHEDGSEIRVGDDASTGVDETDELVGTDARHDNDNSIGSSLSGSRNSSGDDGTSCEGKDGDGSESDSDADFDESRLAAVVGILGGASGKLDEDKDDGPVKPEDADGEDPVKENEVSDKQKPKVDPGPGVAADEKIQEQDNLPEPEAKSTGFFSWGFGTSKAPKSKEAEKSDALESIAASTEQHQPPANDITKESQPPASASTEESQPPERASTEVSQPPSSTPASGGFFSYFGTSTTQSAKDSENNHEKKTESEVEDESKKVAESDHKSSTFADEPEQDKGLDSKAAPAQAIEESQAPATSTALDFLSSYFSTTRNESTTSPEKDEVVDSAVIAETETKEPALDEKQLETAFQPDEQLAQSDEEEDAPEDISASDDPSIDFEPSEVAAMDPPEVSGVSLSEEEKCVSETNVQCNPEQRNEPITTEEGVNPTTVVKAGKVVELEAQQSFPKATEGSEPSKTKEEKEREENSSSSDVNEEESEEGSSSEEEVAPSIKIKDAPILRLENVTAQTRNQIPVDRLKKTGGSWGWGDIIKGIGMESKSTHGSMSTHGAESKHGADQSSHDGAVKTDLAAKIAADMAKVKTNLAASKNEKGTVDNNKELGAGKPIGDPVADEVPERKEIKFTKEAPAETKKKKKKEKKGGLGAHFKKDVRKVSRYGDDVSVGTTTIQKKTGDEQQHVVVAPQANALTEEGSNETSKDLRPWEKETKVLKASNMPKTPLGVNKSIDEEDGSEGSGAESSNIESFKDDLESMMEGSLMESQMEESQIASENEDMNDELESLTALESALKRHEEEENKEEGNFDDVWDTASADVATAIEFERKQRQNFRKKREKKSRKKGKDKDGDKDDEDSKEMQRLSLFGDNKKKSGKKKGKKDKDKISTEFLSAIREVFNEDSDAEASRVSDELDGSTGEMEDDGSDRSEKSEKSLFVGGINTELKKSNHSKSDGDDSDEDQSLGSDYESRKSKSTGSDDSDSSSGDEKSRRSARSSRTKSSKSHRSKKHKKSRTRRRASTKKPKLNPSEILEAELKRQEGTKSMSISSLKQEMNDRRGTSTNMLKKEFEKTKREREAAAAGWNDQPLIGNFPGKTNSKTNASSVENFGKLSSKLEAHEGPTEGQNSRGGGLAGHLSRWDGLESVNEMDDLKTIQHQDTFSESGPLGFGGGLGALDASNISDASKPSAFLSAEPRSGLLSAEPLDSLKQSRPLGLSPGNGPMLLSQPSNEGSKKEDDAMPVFGDFPMMTIAEGDIDTERGLLAGDYNDDDGISESGHSKKSGRGFTFKVKAPKIGLGGIGKRFRRGGGSSSKSTGSSDWGSADEDEFDDNEGLLGG